MLVAFRALSRPAQPSHFGRLLGLLVCGVELGFSLRCTLQWLSVEKGTRPAIGHRSTPKSLPLHVCSVNAVPLVPKTKRRRWRLKGGPPNVNEDDALLDRAIGEAEVERNVLLSHTQHNIELLQQEIIKRGWCGDHSTEGQFVFNDMNSLKRHRRI